MGQRTIRPIVPVRVKSELGSCLTYALIDSGASISAIRLDTADAVGARVTQKESKLVTFG